MCATSKALNPISAVTTVMGGRLVHLVIETVASVDALS